MPAVADLVDHPREHGPSALKGSFPTGQPPALWAPQGRTKTAVKGAKARQEGGEGVGGTGQPSAGLTFGRPTSRAAARAVGPPSGPSLTMRSKISATTFSLSDQEPNPYDHLLCCCSEMSEGRPRRAQTSSASAS